MKVSVDSLTLSFAIVTWKVIVVVPARRSAPADFDTKSPPADAVPATVVTVTVTGVVAARVSVIGTLTVVVPLSPSVTLALRGRDAEIVVDDRDDAETVGEVESRARS